MNEPEPKNVTVKMASQFNLMKSLIGDPVWQWRGNDNRGYSPKFSDLVEAVEYPLTNPLVPKAEYDRE